ncbi:MAG TPA: putative glycoside hydrolase [Deltaproteobacteria bacterium]|nr:putative glycoside hydrolase [Deltaproteobacteria bacterium]HOI06207.1 putative glycoside hydrolase [Deltaproteobacteria bacterium]
MKRFLFTVIFCLSSLLAFAAETPDRTGYEVYTVQKGDTLARIAARYMPLTAAYTKKELVNSIRAINNITNGLSIGQRISIPVAWKEPIKARAVLKEREYPAKGLYINTSNSGTRFVFEAAAKLRKAGGNTIVFDAKDDMGAITYRSPIPARYCPNEKYTPNIEELPKLIDYLHRQGIHVVARVVVFRDPIMARVRPEWCSKREKSWLDPANPEVQEYILTVIRELTASGVDEIQLDYVRYFADLKTHTSNGTLRTDVIANFVKRVHDITKPKGVLLSLDMFGIVVWQRDVDVLTVGQDVTKLKGNVDIISPMLYPSHFNKGFGGVKNPADDPYHFVFNGIRRMKELVGDAVVIRPWLQSFPLGVTRGYDARYVQDQIDAARDSGATGWLMWSPGNHYREAYAAMENAQREKPQVREARTEAKAREHKGQAPAGKGEKAVQPVDALHPVQKQAPDGTAVEDRAETGTLRETAPRG